MKTKKMCGIAILTAMYCVLSFFMKFTLIGNIQVDLGYIALAIGCAFFGVWGAFIGAVGCGIESILFSSYGFSISWFVGNLIIGLGCGIVFKKTNNIWLRIISVIVFVALGILIAKTFIECYLYSIPFEVKIIKNAVAFATDTLVMVGGTVFSNVLKRKGVK